jgi:purine-cytosine permease-like protein
MVGFQVAQAGNQKLIKAAEDYFIHKKRDAFDVSVKIAKRGDYWNWAGGVVFILAIILTVCFVSINVARLRNG